MGRTLPLPPPPRYVRTFVPRAAPLDVSAPATFEAWLLDPDAQDRTIEEYAQTEVVMFDRFRGTLEVLPPTLPDDEDDAPPPRPVVPANIEVR